MINLRIVPLQKLVLKMCHIAEKLPMLRPEDRHLSTHPAIYIYNICCRGR